CFLEIVRSIELVVPEKLPNRAMQAVGTGFDGGVQNSGAGAAKLSAEVRGLDLELLNGIHRRKDDKVRSVQEVHRVRIVVNAVKQIIVLGRTQTIGSKRAASGVAARVRLRRVHSGGKLGKKGEVPSVQGKAINVAFVDHLSHRRILRLEHRG